LQTALVEANCWLELKSPADLNRARRAYIAVPGAEAIASSGSYVVDERETGALIVNPVIDEVVSVEGIEKVKAKLEIHSFSDLRILR
jgi:hypothetical protein